jgi:hypothetical protein
MRSLLLRWGVAVVVGTLWGAIVSPRTPGGTRASKATSLISDAAHCPQSTKGIQWLASSGNDNPNNL